MKLALGKLGWTEYEYYTCSPEGFYYACQGYYAKIEDESLATRNLSYIVYQLGGGKKSLDAIWPIGKKSEAAPKVELPTRDLWDKIKKAESFMDKSIAKSKPRNKK